jgi:hypothetical protein
MEDMRPADTSPEAGLDQSAPQYVSRGEDATDVRMIGNGVLAQVSPEHVEGLVHALGKDWYADGDEIRAAIAAGRAFNLIHIPWAQRLGVTALLARAKSEG